MTQIPAVLTESEAALLRAYQRLSEEGQRSLRQYLEDELVKDDAVTRQQLSNDVSRLASTLEDDLHQTTTTTASSDTSSTGALHEQRPPKSVRTR